MTKEHSKLLNWLGITMRAGGLVTGDEASMNKVRQGQACLVILADDIGSNSRKKYQDKCKTFGVPLLCTHTKVELGHALGKPERAILAITNRGLAEQILRTVRESNGGDVIE